MKLGIICGRSWIGKAVIDRTPDIQVYSKDFPCDVDDEWAQLDALFLIAGQVRPDGRSKERELQLLRRVLETAPHGLRVIYLSSSEIERNTDYGRHKLLCEVTIRANMKSQDWICTRPPAIYGPGQSSDSDMLVPSLARTEGALELREPNIFREYVHIDDLVDHLLELAEYGFASSYNTLRATPDQLKKLFNTWKSYR